MEADDDAERAEQFLADANIASERSTQFVLLAVLLALVLFFASIATKFTGPKVQVLLAVVGLSLLVVSLVRMALLDNTV